MKLGCNDKRCEQCGRRVDGIGITANVIMVFMKLTVGYFGGSKSCIADGLHSFTNILSALVITFSRKVGEKRENDHYPLGYGKIEFIGAAFISVLILFAAVLLSMGAFGHLMAEPPRTPAASTIMAALISIAVNEMLFRYMSCVGTKLGSRTVMANAWANRADMFSSTAVIIGVLGSWAGFAHMDALCALAVVVIIIKVSLDILMDAVKALMDVSVNHRYEKEIRMILSEMETVSPPTSLRTRHMGRKVWAELSIPMNAGDTIGAGERLRREIEQHLLGRMGDLERVVVYIDPPPSPGGGGTTAA